jgi:hypothetical protein
MTIMGLFDFLKPKKEKKFGQKTDSEAPPAPKPKRDLGVCIPVHARTAEERKKLKNEKSPFEELQKEHEKEMTHTLRDIESQEPEEPYDYAPELGVEGIDSNKEKESSTGEKPDELDAASQKMSEGYVPRFSSTARQKLGLEEKAPQQAAPIQAEFEVSGVYPGAESMISGRVIRGKINKRLTAQTGKGTLRISDIKVGSSTVQELYQGESGTIFARGIISALRNGDILEFS